MKLSNSNYYQDTSHVSHSMLCSLVDYGKYGSRTIMPDYYHARHITQVIPFQKTDAMTVGTIVDEYFGHGPEVLEEYPVVSRRSGKDPKEITNSMSETVGIMITSLGAFKTFQDFINLSDTLSGEHEGSIISNTIDLPNGTLSLKGKVDFINHTKKQVVDLKTTGNITKVLDDLMFRGTPNITARYIRQMAYYRYIIDPINQDYEMALAVVDENGRVIFIPIRKDILDAAWKMIVNDLNDLAMFYKTGFNNLVLDPFGPLAEIIPQSATEEMETF